MEKAPAMGSKERANQALDSLVAILARGGSADLNQLPITEIRNGIKTGTSESKQMANQALDQLVKTLNDKGENLQELSAEIDSIRRAL